MIWLRENWFKWTKNSILVLSAFAVIYLLIAEVFGVYDDEAFFYSIPSTILTIYLYQKHGK